MVSRVSAEAAPGWPGHVQQNKPERPQLGDLAYPVQSLGPASSDRVLLLGYRARAWGAGAPWGVWMEASGGEQVLG